MKKFFQNLRSLRRRFFPTTSESAQDLCERFASRFPGRCLICSFHNYGFQNGMTNEPLPPTHTCIENPRTDANLK